MGLPLNDRSENVVSSIGIETYPENVIVKGSLWTLNLIYNRFLLKDYEGNSFVIDILAKDYAVTIALNNDRTINSNKFWLWVIDISNQLSLYEIEPFVLSPPTVTVIRSNIATSVATISSYIQANDAVRIVTLSTSNELIVISYPNIKLSATHVTKELTWEATRLPNFSNFVAGNKDQLDLVYLNVLSPPNIYLESHSVLAPINLAGYQVGSTTEVILDWEAAVDADQYVLERDTNSSFPSPVEVYTGPAITFSDTVNVAGGYYYRVKSQISDLYLESTWAPWINVSVSFISLVADFEASSTDVPANAIVTFTDLSTPPETVTAWEWDFGDGSTHSTEQNPMYVYTQAGIYTVTLTAFSGVYSDVSDPQDIYVNMVAEFSANITSGNAELLVQFTDESLGIPTSWLWDFGDGSTSTEQNPFHLYTEPGSHTVTLTASRESGVGPYTDTEVKADLISVYTRAEFVGTPRVGYNNLTVQFADLSTGSPTTWFWSFGDGEYSTEVNPVHTYASPGAYSVQLTVSSSFNSDAEYKSNYIIVEGTATPDIAPEPDILLYLTGEVKSNKESKGIKVSFLRNKTS